MNDTSSQVAVIHYSRSGHSARIARVVAERLGTTTSALVAPNYGGPFGFMRAAAESLLQRSVPVRIPCALDRYERLVICGPVWTSYPAVPLRACLRACAGLPLDVGLFLTCGDAEVGRRALPMAEQDFGQTFEATAVLANADEKTRTEAQEIAQFCEAMLAPHSVASPS